MVGPVPCACSCGLVTSLESRLKLPSFNENKPFQEKLSLRAATLAASDVPLVSLGVSNPKTWGVSGWASDLIPHLIYGFVTAVVYDALSQND